MGTGINVQCGKCRYNGSFMLGSGAYYILIENCLEALPPKQAEEVTKLLKKQPIENYSFGYELFQCDGCLFLFDHGNLKINFENNTTYENKTECPACQTDMSDKNTLIDKINELTCPICLSEDMMTLAGTLDWD